MFRENKRKKLRSRFWVQVTKIEIEPVKGLDRSERPLNDKIV